MEKELQELAGDRRRRGEFKRRPSAATSNNTSSPSSLIGGPNAPPHSNPSNGAARRRAQRNRVNNNNNNLESPAEVDFQSTHLWPATLLCDEMIEKNPEWYAELCAMALDPSIERKISADTPRTFPLHPFFKPKRGQDTLYRILRAYAIFYPHVAYCQGMNFVAGILLLAHMSEEEAFWGFVHMMKHFKLYKNFRPGLSGLQKHMNRFDKLLPVFLPAVHNHLQHYNIIAGMFATKWFLTLFAGALPLDAVLQIWDVFLVEGWPFIYAAGLALLECCQVKILKSDFEETLTCLSCMLTSLADYEEDDVEWALRGGNEHDKDFRMYEDSNPEEAAAKQGRPPDSVRDVDTEVLLDRAHDFMRSIKARAAAGDPIFTM